jgi:hypothetical protein
MILQTALIICGIFTLILGIVHFFFPILLDFEEAIPLTGRPLKALRLGPIRYKTKRSDVRGIAWVMNHAASYTLISIGLVDLLSYIWLESTVAVFLCLWIAGWWFIRAGSQLYLGRRPGDWRILAGFTLLAVVHVWAAFA